MKIVSKVAAGSSSLSTGVNHSVRSSRVSTKVMSVPRILRRVDSGAEATHNDCKWYRTSCTRDEKEPLSSERGSSSSYECGEYVVSCSVSVGEKVNADLPRLDPFDCARTVGSMTLDGGEGTAPVTLGATEEEPVEDAGRT